eukprot:CAMPEP_0115196880 /NCGR_PEP_ID=MMETSP0270-20121206/15312_1 /TAXON_ID=71861 /ORGANISM="Scrippsiella trochoidea, Strain CCMP3099" /LENGTH=438 /DNA_ID=CAMNT_0002610223 /DNA_START=91 /DNA_END=1405 /DNA_ORIENTATION=-
MPSDGSDLGAAEDKCFELFGDDENKCADVGLMCSWGHDDFGTGKCTMKPGHEAMNRLCKWMGSDISSCAGVGICKWVEDDNGEGTCKAMSNERPQYLQRKPCSQFPNLAECAAADGLCEWSQDSGKCFPTFTLPDPSCDIKIESECAEIDNACEWSEGACITQGVADTCKDTFGTDQARCFKQSWLCKWAEDDNNNGTCTMNRERSPFYSSQKLPVPCRQFADSAECSGSDGLCEWSQEQAKCNPAFMVADPVCLVEHRFSVDEEGCLQQQWLCKWVGDESGGSGEGTCKMKTQLSVVRDVMQKVCPVFGSDSDSCTTLFFCQWSADDFGKGTCTVKPKWSEEQDHSLPLEVPASLAHLEEARPCRQFRSNTTCAWSDGLCQWSEDTDGGNEKCLPNFTMPDFSCFRKQEDMCSEAGDACVWTGARCRPRVQDVCQIF